MKSAAFLLGVIVLTLQCGLITYGLHTATDFAWFDAYFAGTTIFIATFFFEKHRGYVISRNVLGATLCYYSFEHGIITWIAGFILTPLLLANMFRPIITSEE
jgi:hypothetical protein